MLLINEPVLIVLLDYSLSRVWKGRWFVPATQICTNNVAFFWIENNREEVTPSEISWSRLITPSRDLSPGIHVLMHEEGGRDFQGEIKSR